MEKKDKTEILNTKELPKNFLVFIFPHSSQEEVEKISEIFQKSHSFAIGSGIKVLYQKSEWEVLET